VFIFTGGLAHILAQSQPFPQLHSLLSFIGQFLPVFLQLGLSAANPTEQSLLSACAGVIYGFGMVVLESANCLPGLRPQDSINGPRVIPGPRKAALQLGHS
jgi:hypothetical protein